VAIAWSPDGKFVISGMQENALHGWRVADEKNMRMGGYPAKVKSLAFLAKGNVMATSGANGVVVWPFAGSTGPMGKQAAEVGYEERALATRVAAMPGGNWVAWGLDDGRVRACDLIGQRIVEIKAERGVAISALAMTPDGRRVAWGDEDGQAGTADIA
jgi:WD40 repeat protein